jgi:hemolysin III
MDYIAHERKERREELANSLTHGLGTAFAIAALVVMVVFASLRGSARHIVGAAFFGAGLVVLYLMSTLYHALPPGRAKRVMRVMDHAGIFLLIASTYTPLCLATLKGPWGWSLFGVVWGLAIVGITLKASLFHRMSWISTAIYLLMGWVVVIALVPLFQRLPAPGLAWLFGGGLFYSGGVIFYRWHKLTYHHALWHLCVLAGSACHVACVLGYVIPR